MKKRWAVFLLALGVVGVGFALWLYRAELAAWYEFSQQFERLGLNEQGYSEYRHRSTGLVMVGVPGGTFLMGSPETEDGAWWNERPRHSVTLDPFLVAKYEVSQAIWREVMGTDPSSATGDSLPVEQVSWSDCREFCRKAGLELPSEAQWESACRGGTDMPFAFGESLTSDRANFDGNFPYVAGQTDSQDAHREGSGEFRRRTVPVDSFEPNGFGLYNMHGNVWEWCEDAFNEDFYRKPEATQRNPLCTVGTGNRVARGGGWFNRARYCRSASRAFEDPARRSQSLGFRPVFNLR